MGRTLLFYSLSALFYRSEQSRVRDAQANLRLMDRLDQKYPQWTKPLSSCAARIASTRSPARAKSWGLSRKQTRREPAPSPLIVQTQKSASPGRVVAAFAKVSSLQVRWPSRLRHQEVSAPDRPEKIDQHSGPPQRIRRAGQGANNCHNEIYDVPYEAADQHRAHGGFVTEVPGEPEDHAQCQQRPAE